MSANPSPANPRPRLARGWLAAALPLAALLCGAVGVLSGAQSQQPTSATESPRPVFARPTVSFATADSLDDAGTVQFGTIGTTHAITLRLADAGGRPLTGLAMTPLVASEPDGVTRHTTVTLVEAATNAAGELHFFVVPGDKPGRYELVFLPAGQPPRPETMTRLAFVAQDTNWPTLLLLSLGGGLALFLYGFKVASDGLIGMAGNRLRNALGDLTRNPLLGLVSGAAVTCFTQSSGATTVMLMSFVRAHLLTFRNSLAVVLGSAIGGTITVQLISFDLFRYALPAIACGFLAYLVAKNPRVESAGLTLLGFGVAFFGLEVMTEQMAPLKSFPFFRAAVHALGDYPIWSVLFSAALTALAQSSGAVLGIVLSLARQDLISLEHAIPLFYGASIGVCFTGFTASVGAPAEARRVAWAHFIYKVCGVVVFLPLVAPLDFLGVWVTQMLSWSPTAQPGEFAARAIANTYTLFITMTAFATLPFISVLERVTRRMIPDEPETADGDLRTKYLDHQIVDNPAAALGSARREISRMGRFVDEMMRQIVAAILDKDEPSLEFIRARDNKVDFLNAEITRFLTSLTNNIEEKADMDRALELLYIVSDLESIGDIIDKNLVPLARKMIVNSLDFSDDGKAELRELHHKVADRLSRTLIALTTNDRAIAGPIADAFETLQDEGKRLHLQHLHRVRDGLRVSVETSSIHLDVINYLMRLDYLTYDICLHIAGRAKWIGSGQMAKDRG